MARLNVAQKEMVYRLYHQENPLTVDQIATEMNCDRTFIYRTLRAQDVKFDRQKHKPEAVIAAMKKHDCNTKAAAAELGTSLAYFRELWRPLHEKIIADFLATQ